MKAAYNYVILRYVHDVVSGEFVNVGVVLVAPSLGFMGAICTPRYQRISQFFSGISGKHYREIATFVQSKIDDLTIQLTHGLRISSMPETADKLVEMVLPGDDSSFQLSSLRAGIVNEDQLDTLLEELYNRYVERYEKRQGRPTRSDEQVWKPFRNALERRQLAVHFERHVVRTPHYDFEFPRAFRNGRLNVCQPISFDLASPDEVRDKAVHWFGRLEQLGESEENFKAYLLLGEPSSPDLRSAFRDAREILSEVTSEKALFLENQSDSFAQSVSEDLTDHHGD